MNALEDIVSGSEVSVVTKPSETKKAKKRKNQDDADDDDDKIPGGRLEIVKDSQAKDCVPNSVAFHIRAYLDVLLGATSIEKIRLASLNCNGGRASRDTLYAIPTVVDAILKYNNISFNTVVLYKTKVDLIEPIWYDINLQNNELRLFTNGDSRMFPRQMTDYPLIVTSGIIPLERYNPYETHEMLENLDIATIHCSVMCDHVAQHIIDDVFNKEPKIEGVDIHDRFGRFGTTLHSIFDITVMGDRCEPPNETSKLVAIFDARSRTKVDDIFGNLSAIY